MKAIKWLILLIAMMTLAKCGYDGIVYGDTTPKVNPHPTKKVRIHGKFPFDENVTLKFDVTYVNANPKCDTVYRTFGFVDAIVKKTAYSEGLPATVNEDGTYEAIIYLDNYLPGFCEYKPLFMDFNFYYKFKNDGGGGTAIRFVDKKIAKHSINFNCELIKKKYEWAKKVNEPGYICELEKNQYFIDYSKMLGSMNPTTQDYIESHTLHGDFNEIPINQNDIELNFKSEGAKQ
ncbi:MAG: hypothetical protein PHV08_00390 [Sulfurovaceae bacterium]|nr:hypothetical protein [Sulfurovaceae bacterium]